MDIENFKNLVKKFDKVISENDINETMPKPVAKTIVKIGSLPFQINHEIKKFSLDILEKYNAFKREKTEEPLEKKLSDTEMRNISETIRGIRSLPKEEQQQKLAEVKESLSWFKIELGKAEQKIITGLLENPPQTKEATFEYIKTNLAHLPVPFNEYGGILALSDNFFERYQSIQKMRETMTDEQLFNEACNKDPVGDIEVKTTPVGFYFRTHDLQDYSNLYFRNENDPKDVNENKERMLDANKSGGFKNFGLTVENAQGKFFLGRNKSVYEHELQHVIYGTMEQEMDEVWASGRFSEQVNDFWKRFPENQEDSIGNFLEKRKQTREILKELYERRLPYVLNRGKDELLAYTIDNDHSTSKIYDILSAPLGLYNYFRNQKDNLTSLPYISDYQVEIPESIQKEIDTHEEWDIRYDLGKEYREKEVKKIEAYFNSYADEVGTKIFVKKYHDILWEGAESLQKLKDSGIEREVIVRILTREPLDKWPKVVQRLLEKPTS